jgi:asparagine synthase (glutamine-hydrolysing)
MLVCGRFGVYLKDRNRQPNRHQLDQSVRAIAHRGPNGSGVHAGDGIGLVHTRLSLLDLSERSNQPFWDASRRYVFVYNGEVYNFAELRRDLEAHGFEFRTTSDAEVVLYALIHYGAEEGTRKLEGMFAYALYDTVEHEVTIARDRLGIKPLYLLRRDNEVYFASEFKAFAPWHRFEANLPRMIGFLMNAAVPMSDGTFCREVEFVAPGKILKIDSNGVRTLGRLSRADYWDPDRAAQLARLNDEQLIDEFDKVFQKSVQSQLVADAPVGALCSGGVDSSLVMGVASRHHSNLAIFHANVVGPLSEYEHAAALARHLKLDLLKVDVTDRDFVQRMPQIIEHWGCIYLHG